MSQAHIHLYSYNKETTQVSQNNTCSLQTVQKSSHPTSKVMSSRSGHSPLSLMHSSGGRAGHLKIDVTALARGQCLHQVPPCVTHVVTGQAAQAAPRWPSFTACPSHQGESNYFNTICLGLGCVTTHRHQQEHKATLKCAYVRHSYVGTIFSHDKLLCTTAPTLQNGDKLRNESWFVELSEGCSANKHSPS